MPGWLAALSFASPWVLAALALLPALYFILRATPPAPHRQVFPPLRLLRGIALTQRTPVRMPLWLLLLRLLAMALVIVGFAGPEIVPPKILPGSGPVLLAIDNGWASAAGFEARRAAARRIIDQAGARGVVLLATAGDASGRAPRATGVLSRIEALSAVGALHAEAWPPDRAADAVAVRAARTRQRGLTGVYLADGLAAPGLDGFIKALAPARIVSASADRVRLLETPDLGPEGSLIARLAVVPQREPVVQPVLAETASGTALARVSVTVRPGAANGATPIDLPVALEAKVARLVLPGVASPGGVALLDGRQRRVVVGLAAGGTADAEQHLLGALYYVRRALPQDAEVRTGSIRTLPDDGVGAVILADLPLRPGEVAALRRFMAEGGVVIRFAGALTAAKPDALTPDALLPGVRVLGGSLATGRPERIGGFAAQSPLAGLALPREVRVTRQILADPAALDPATVWARLDDGTPIVLGKRSGRGALVDVLTTANAAWSNWPIAADFPALIDRMVRLGGGTAPKSGVLTLLHGLDGTGQLVMPGAGARPLQAAKLAGTMVSSTHPPGVWGNAQGAAALNLGGHVPAPAAASFPALVPVTGLDALPRARRFGPGLLAAALALLIIDLLIALLLRGVVRRRAAAAGLILLFGGLAAGGRSARADVPQAALTTTLAYVKTGDASVDSISRAGLAALSATVNQETAATLGTPHGVAPGVDNLNLYPLLYWPITSATQPPDAGACAALDRFMAGGGLLVIDTDGGGTSLPGSGAGFDPGAGAALRRATACLSIPPLEVLTDRNTLAHTFYLAREFPGRFDGAPVYIATRGTRDADGVSPVVIGANDWAGAWAVDGSGDPMMALLPGTPGQREQATWFGVNLVMYALTGTYKADQVQVPTILRRLGQ